MKIVRLIFFLHQRLAIFMLLALALARDFDISAQQLDPDFSPPLFWDRFGYDASWSSGPAHSFVDGRGGVYVFGNGGADVVGGRWFQEPIRLLETSGAVDTNFRSEVTGGWAMAIQPDGKVLISSYSDGAAVVARLTTSGALDPSFTPVGFDQGIRHLAMLPDGKILVAVFGNHFGNPSPWVIPVPNPTVFRLHANGTVDESFRRPEFAGGFTTLFAPPVADATGRIYLGGSFTSVNGIARANIVRLLTSGEVDQSFAGAASIAGGLAGTIRGIAIQSSGRVVVVGDLRVPATAASGNRIAAIRFDANGQFDTSFTTNKVSQLGLGDYPRDMVLRPDDKFVVVCRGLRQFNADGTIDPLFKASDFTYAFWISRLSDGRLMVPGIDSAEGLSVFAPDGTPDLTFKTGGFGRTTPPNSYAFLNDGRIAVCGRFNRVDSQTQLGLAILNPESGQASSSQPDLSPLEPSTVMSYSSPSAFQVAPGSSNTFWFLASVMGTNGMARSLFGKVLANGSFDPAMPVQELSRPTNNGDALYALADGRLLVVDNSAQGAVNGNPVRRLLPNGTVDPTFAGLDAELRGQLARVTWLADNSIRRIDVGLLRILTSSGPTNLLASVNTISGEARLVRIDANGQVDGAFSGPAVTGLTSGMDFAEVFNPLTLFYEQPNDGTFVFSQEVFPDAAELPDGRMLVCGQFHELGPISVTNLARLNANGGVDTNFPGVRLEYSKSLFWEPRLTSIEADAQGRIYVAGLFDRINTLPAPGLARLLPDGTVDETFHSPITISPFRSLAVDLKLVGRFLYVFGYCMQGSTNRMGCRLQVEEDLTLAWQPSVTNRLELNVPSSPTKATMVQASDDLASWVDVFTNAAGAAATRFTDPESAGKSHRYYRLRQ